MSTKDTQAPKNDTKKKCAPTIDISVRNVDAKTWRILRAHAARHNVTMAQVIKVLADQLKSC